MYVPGLEVKSELQLQAYTTAMATLDPSRIFSLYHSLQQHQVLNLLSESSDRTSSSQTLRWVLNPLSHNRNSEHCFFEVRLIYSAVLVSGVQQSDSVMHTHTYIFFFRFFPIIGYYKIVTIVP